MRIDAHSPRDVLVLLTEEEAEGVANALRNRLEQRRGFQSPGYHLHLEGDNGEELTIGVLDAQEAPASP